MCNWVHRGKYKHTSRNVTEYIQEIKKTQIKKRDLINVSEQLSSYYVMFVSFCGQDGSCDVEVECSCGSCARLLQDIMLVVPDPFEQSFVGVLGQWGWSGVTVAIQTKPNTSTDECFDVLLVGGGGEPPPGRRGIEQLGQDYFFQHVVTHTVIAKSTVPVVFMISLLWKRWIAWKSPEMHRSCACCEYGTE